MSRIPSLRALTSSLPHVRRRAGRRAGRQDGRALGIQKGFEVGHEIGYYAGSVQIWRQVEAMSPGFIGARAERAIAALEDLLLDFPLASPRVSGVWYFTRICAAENRPSRQHQ